MTQPIYITGNIPMPGNQSGVFDYYIKDQLGNVRMTLSEELNKSAATCTMEDAAATAEQALFGNPSPNNEVANTRDNKPVAWSANSSLKVSKPNRTGASLSHRHLSASLRLKDIRNTGPFLHRSLPAYYYPAA